MSVLGWAALSLWAASARPPYSRAGVQGNSHGNTGPGSLLRISGKFPGSDRMRGPISIDPILSRPKKQDTAWSHRHDVSYACGLSGLVVTVFCCPLGRPGFEPTLPIFFKTGFMRGSRLTWHGQKFFCYGSIRHEVDIVCAEWEGLEPTRASTTPPGTPPGPILAQNQFFIRNFCSN